MRTGLSELTAFIEIADQRSFSAASRKLGVSASALSHTLRGLEERLEVRLFNRTTRSVALTEAGEQLLSRVRPAVADLEDALSQAASAHNRPSGTVRISTAESKAIPLIRHVLPDFLDTYPDINVEFVVNTRLVDIVAEGFDAGIRIMEAVPRDMIGIQFGPDIRFVAVASPKYLANREPPLAPQDLANHRCLRFRYESGALYRWELEHRGRVASIDVGGPMIVGSLRLMVEAALGGIGIGWVPEDEVVEHLESGRLVQLLADWSPSFAGLCLYYPANRHPPTALKLFAQAVRDWANKP